jgi:hypothetical protein
MPFPRGQTWQDYSRATIPLVAGYTRLSVRLAFHVDTIGGFLLVENTAGGLICVLSILLYYTRSIEGITYDTFFAGITIFVTVIVSSCMLPVRSTVCPAWICKSASSWFAML